MESGSPGAIRRIGEGQEQINGVVFSHDGKAVVTGGNRTVRLWEVGTGRNLAAFQGHGASVEGVSFSPDDQTIASVDDHGLIHFWDVASGAAGKIASRQGRLWCAEFSPDGRTLATSSADGSVRLWDSLLDRDRISIRMPSQKVPTISFSADGKIWSRRRERWEAMDLGRRSRHSAAHPAIRHRGNKGRLHALTGRLRAGDRRFQGPHQAMASSGWPLRFVPAT